MSVRVMGLFPRTLKIARRSDDYREVVMAEEGEPIEKVEQKSYCIDYRKFGNLFDPRSKRRLIFRRHRRVAWTGSHRA